MKPTFNVSAAFAVVQKAEIAPANDAPPAAATARLANSRRVIASAAAVFLLYMRIFLVISVPPYVGALEMILGHLPRSTLSGSI
jgi:hypothetical protein